MSQMNPDHAFPTHLNFILILSSHLLIGHPDCLFPSGSSTKALPEIYFILHTCHMPRPSSFILSSEYGRCICSAQITNPIFMQFSQSLCCDPLVRSKYHPQRPLLEHPQLILFPQCKRSQDIEKNLWPCAK
jgi:hypothetical protein